MTCNVRCLTAMKYVVCICRLYPMQNIILITLLYLHATSVMCNVNKRRLCLSYSLGSSRADCDILHTTVASGEHRCMINCARHPNCWAFNLINNGTCELLPTSGDCGEARLQTSSVFVHLSTCDGKNHQEIIPRNWTIDKCLIWIPHRTGSSRSSGVLKSSRGDYWFSLAPNYNLYMPGWFNSPLGFRCVTEDQRIARCPEGYLLKVAPRCTATWQNYSAGDPIHPKAAKVSVWRDGTPIYGVEYLLSNGFYYIGYYLPNVQTAYIMAGTVFNPANVHILLLNWDAMMYVI